MKNFTQFFKTTFILATILLLGGGNVWGAWSWTGETHSNGDTNFYLRCAENSTWLGLGYDGATMVPWAHSSIDNALVYNTAEYTVKSWGITYYKQSLYFVDGTTNYYLKSNAGNTSFETSVDDNNTNCQFKEEDSSNRYYHIEVNNGDRYFQAGVVNGRVNAPKKGSATNNAKKWQQISAAQMNTYNNRFFYFQANPQVGVGEGSVVAQEEIVYELANYADRLNTPTQTLTFSATPDEAQGYQFEGWYETSDCSGNRVSNANPYTPSVSNDAAGVAGKKTVTLYAKFVAEQTPVILINEGADAMLVDDAVAVASMFTTEHTPSLVYTLEDNDGVLSLTEGTLTALKVGSATIVVTQNAVPGIKYGQAKFTITVSKHANTLAPNQALEFYTTYDNLASLFTTNSDGALTFRLTPDGEEITSITTKNETTFTLYVSQAKTEKVYGVSKREIQFSVHAAAHYAPQILKEVADQVDNIEENKTYEITWDNSSYDAGTLSFDYKTSGAATRPNPKVYQQVNGNWILIGDKGKTTNWRTVSDENLNSKATGVKFEFSGTGLGSASVKNVVVTRRDYLETDVQSVNDFNTFEIFYGNIHNVQYELTNVSSSNPSAEYEISLSTDEVISNGEGDYGKYVFAIAASTDAPTTITATAHFFTTEDMHLYIPVSLTFPVSLSLVAMNNENGTDYYYATFSNADYAVEFGEDVEVYTVSVDGDRMTLYPVSNNQVPANNGVLIKSQSNNILYKYISSAANLSNNMLQPGTGDWTTGDNCRFYRLAYYDYAAKTGLGFYYGSGCEDGEAFKCKAGTAYLTVPKDMVSGNAPARFLLGRQDVSTEIENMIIDNTSTSSSLADGKKVMVNGVLYIIRDGKTYDSFGRMVK